MISIADKLRMSTADKLRKVKEYLHLYGWIRGTYGTKHEGFCLMGAAINVSSDLDIPMHDVQGLLDRVCNGGIIHFNDSAENIGDVDAKIDEAIALAEGEEKPE